MFFNRHQEVINQFPEGDSLMIELHCVANNFLLQALIVKIVTTC